MEYLLVLAVIFGFYMAWNIGANDAANSMADALGSGALTLAWAVTLGAICEFSGAVLVGAKVTNTIRKGIIDGQVFAGRPEVLAYGMVCALLAAAAWLHLASIFGMPVSTTHSIVGGVAGMGILLAGVAHVEWGTMLRIVASWFISPVAGGVAAYVIFRLFSKSILARDNPAVAARRGAPLVVFATLSVVALITLFKGLKHLHLELTGLEALGASLLVGAAAAAVSWKWIQDVLRNSEDAPLPEQLARVERIFTVLVVITSCSVAFAHGANDVANAVGPLAAVVEIVHSHELPGKVPVEPWVLILGGSGIAVGLITFGYRVMRVVGTQITELTPSRGVAADISTSCVVLLFSRLGIPISTTHTLVGAVIGVGLARGIAGINRHKVKQIFTAWLATVPIVALLAILFYGIGKVLGLFG